MKSILEIRETKFEKTVGLLLTPTFAGTDTIKGNVNPDNIKKENTEVGRYRPVDGYLKNESQGNPTGARNFASRGLQIVSENGTRGQINYTTDLRGSVRYETTTKDSKTETYNYDFFGESIGKTPEFFGYTGKPFDPQTKMYNYGYRDYTPKSARFSTIDPIRDGANWYGYVGQDPVNKIDAWGMLENDLSQKTINLGTVSTPIMGYVFGTGSDNAYLITAGIHPAEKSGIEVANNIVKSLKKTGVPQGTTVLVVPNLNPQSPRNEGAERDDNTRYYDGSYTLSNKLNRNVGLAGANPPDLAAAKAIDYFDAIKPKKLTNFSLHDYKIDSDPNYVNLAPMYDPSNLTFDKNGEAKNQNPPYIESSATLAKKIQMDLGGAPDVRVKNWHTQYEHDQQQYFSSKYYGTNNRFVEFEFERSPSGKAFIHPVTDAILNVIAYNK